MTRREDEAIRQARKGYRESLAKSLIGGPWFWPFASGMVTMLVLIAALQACTPRDDSDPIEGPRSGVTPVWDALTGCEYLKAPGGGITPRMDNTGKQVCRIRYTQELPLEGAP